MTRVKLLFLIMVLFISFISIVTIKNYNLDEKYESIELYQSTDTIIQTLGTPDIISNSTRSDSKRWAYYCLFYPKVYEFEIEDDIIIDKYYMYSD